MSWHDISALESELEDIAELSPEWDVALETPGGRNERVRRTLAPTTKERILRFARNRVLGFMLTSLRNDLPAPAFPPPEWPVTVVESPASTTGPPGARRRKKEREEERQAELESIRAHYPEAQLMEHLARLATRTSNEAEAEALIGAMLPLAGRVVPPAEQALLRAAPQLLRGLAGTARLLRSHPATRPLVSRIPALVRGTAVEVGRRSSRGQAVHPETVVRALVRQAMRVLSEDGPEPMVGDPAGNPNDGVNANIFHWRNIDAIGRYLRGQKWNDIRTATAQVAGGRGDPVVMATGRGGSTKGMKFPDQQAIDLGGRRVHIEVDTVADESRRHQARILRADNNRRLGTLGVAGKSRGVFIVQDPQTGRVTEVRHVDPLRQHNVKTNYGPQGVPLSLLLKRGVLNYPVPAQVLRARSTSPTRRPKTARRVREAELLAV